MRFPPITRAALATFLGLTFASSAVFWWLIISGAGGQGRPWVLYLMWCPGVSALVAHQRFDLVGVALSNHRARELQRGHVYLVRRSLFYGHGRCAVVSARLASPRIGKLLAGGAATRVPQPVHQAFLDRVTVDTGSTFWLTTEFGAALAISVSVTAWIFWRYRDRIEERGGPA